jgi:UDP-N-acetylglucosamine/UDP-N-acetylgalactosamine diphosphorylase
MDASKLIADFRAAGQGQVFAFWDSLPEGARAQLLAEAAEVDLAEVERLNRSLVFKSGAGGVNLDGLAPAPYERLPEKGGDATKWAGAQAAGEAALRAGRVAAFTVAGGQGTRLGYDGPKGTFAVTPLKGKPLFQVFAEKIMAAGRRYGRPLHWFIMTSHANHAQTEAFFAERGYFGLDRARVHFFRQGRMPAVDFSGKILLESAGSLALSPDGHGGSLRALHRSGALDLMTSEGIDTISFFQVDNPLIRCIDPAFIGFHLQAGSEMSNKMVPKAYPEEKVGHFCVQDGKVIVVEYSDMPLAMQRVALPFHRADKKIPAIDAAGRPVKPEKANGVKFEMFVFDALPFARNSVVIETRRADDFSPVKNAEGLDSPKTARDDQLRQYARWLRAAGAAVETDASGLPKINIEVSPLFGYDAGSFGERWHSLPVKPVVTDGFYLE